MNNDDYNNRFTLLGYISSPLMTSIIKKSIFGNYVQAINLLQVETIVYILGSILGYSLYQNSEIPINLLFVRDTQEHKISELAASYIESAKLTRKNFENWSQGHPIGFDDVLFYVRIESLLNTSKLNLHVSPKEVYKMYLDGDKTLKKLFNKKVDINGVVERIMSVLLQGIFFGKSFPDFSKAIYEQTIENNKSFLSSLWPEIYPIPPQLDGTCFDEAQEAVMKIIELYISEYHPEIHLNLDTNDTFNQYEPTKYEVLNEILSSEGKNILNIHLKNPDLLGESIEINTNPFNQTDYQYLLSSFLSGPSHLGHFDTEKLESILKKLLQDDYDHYYRLARTRIIDNRKFLKG